MEPLQEVTGYLPTAVVTLFVGWLGYKNTRASREDTTRMQEKANRVAETQQALDAQKSISDQWQKAFLVSEQRRAAAEEDAEECRQFVRAQFDSALRSYDIPLPKEIGREDQGESH